VLCFGNSTGGANLTVSGGTPTYGYAWSNGSTAEDLLGVASGIYSVTVTDANSCTATASVTLTEPSQLVVSITVLSFYFGQGVSCEGASDGIINASGSGGTPEYNYSWNTSPPQNNVTVGGLPTGTYSVTVSDLNGCTATSSVTLTSNPLPQVKLPPPLIGCVGTGVLINANVESGEKCTWTFSDGQVFNQCGPFSVNFDAVDCYNVKLTVASPEGCTNTVSASNFVCVEPNPVASFYADNYQIDNIQTNANFWNTSVGAESYFWYYSDGSNYDTTYNVYHEFQNGSDFDVINYMVILYAVSEYGCIDSTSRYIKLTPKPILYVPNAFTPDGDIYNSTFYPVLTAGYKSNDYEFLIFNRWGELIFESNTIGEGWDGTYKEHNCQDGVYTWKLVVGRSINGEQLEYTGHITLLRGGGL
jgi:gliding motility-associated-like protein